MEIHSLSQSFHTATDPSKKPHTVQFAPHPTFINTDTLDRRLEKRVVSKISCCVKAFWKFLMVFIGILFFPLGIYWWWRSASLEIPSNKTLPKILKTLPGQIGPKDRNFSTKIYDQIWKDTKKILIQGSFAYHNKPVKLNDSLERAIALTEKQRLIEPFQNCSGKESTKMEIIHADPISLSVSCMDEFHRTRPSQLDGKRYTPVLLYSTQEKAPSGYTKDGLEGELLRRSGIAFCLDSDFGHQNKRLYPLKGDEVIYSPQVPIFRYGKQLQYAFFDPQCISIITTCSSTSSLNRLIYNQLYTAYQKGHDAVVIPLLKDPTAAQIYCQMLSTYFSGTFRRVIFSIDQEKTSLDTHMIHLFKKRPFR